MKYAADLHIHSVLSPCADSDMTPFNIVNMAVLKGLDMIAVTDHNTALNLPAVWKAAINKGLLLIPGIEVQTKEEVHILCYFKSVDTALELGNIIYSKLPDIKNSPDLFGEQWIMDNEDRVVASLDKLLLSSADISIEKLVALTVSMGGVCVPAHVDRSSYSIISNLGFIPRDLNLGAVEISKNAGEISSLPSYPLIKGLRAIRSSDAHYLWDIFERESFISLEYITMSGVLDYLMGK